MSAKKSDKIHDNMKIVYQIQDFKLRGIQSQFM